LGIGTGAIEGVVSDASTSEGLGEIRACAYRVEVFEGEAFVEEGEEGRCVLTESTSGTYTISELPAGQFIVEFTDPAHRYVGQVYNGRTFFEEPDLVTVEAGNPAPGIDARLEEGGRLEGTVTSEETGAPLREITVCAGDFEVEGIGCARTGSAGMYLIGGLPTGTGYEVQFFVPQVPEMNYLNKPLHNVSVQLKKTTKSVNVALPTGGEIEGAVTDAATGTQLSGVEVCALRLPFEFLAECTLTEHGAYLLERLPTGSYNVEFLDPPLYLPQFFSGASSAAEATSVSVVAGAPAVAGIDAKLIPPAQPQPASVAGGPAQPAGPPPAAGAGVLTSKTVIPSLTVLGRLKAAGRVATAKLHCGFGPCKGRLQLLVTVVKREHVKGHTVTRHVTEVLGGGGFSLAQGAFAKVKIELNATGRRLLANAARHPRAAKLELVLQGVHATLRAVVVG